MRTSAQPAPTRESHRHQKPIPPSNFPTLQRHSIMISASIVVINGVICARPRQGHSIDKNRLVETVIGGLWMYESRLRPVEDPS
ncbi:hypothetical protein PILCRDRAFT_810676, partial [Piloderma croceum F 1598]